MTGTVISYTEFYRRFQAATAELMLQPVKIDPRTQEPTDWERRKAKAVLLEHGIDDLELRWENRGWVVCEVPA